ncbi:MAG: hypothetical protein PVI60_08230 [Desulfobacteraceae bacterium]
MKSSVDAEPVNSSAGLPDTVIELGDRLRRYPVRIVNTVERTVMEHPKRFNLKKQGILLELFAEYIEDDFNEPAMVYKREGPARTLSYQSVRGTSVQSWFSPPQFEQVCTLSPALVPSPSST